jgi:CRP-like cAMP-binding protein
MHRIAVAAGETLYREREQSNQAYLVLSGEMSLEHAGTAIPAGPGDLIGFSGLFDRPYGATATAVGSCAVLAFSRKELRSRLYSNPDEAITVIDAMIQLLGRVADALERKALA